MNNPIETRVKRLADKSLVTGVNFELAQRVIDFPQDVKGLKMVDLGGGISTVTNGLRMRGAEAFAVDYRYDDLNNLKASLHPNGFSQIELDEFVRDYAENRERYIPILIGKERLPFEDESVDWIFSTKCLTTILLDDWRTFLRAYEEILRILKPYRNPARSGILILHPWIGGLSMSDVNMVNADQFKKFLGGDKRVDFGVFPIDRFLPTKLVIAKCPKES